MMSKCSDCRKHELELTTWWQRVRHWCFHRFHDEIIDLSQDKYTQGVGDGYKLGFKHADEANQKALMALELDVTRVTPLNGEWLVKSEDVITVQAGKLYLGIDPLDKQNLKLLKSEVKALKNFKIWAILQETLRQKAIEKSVLQSTDFTQVLSGKLMVHSLGVIKSIVNVIDGAK